MNTAIHYAYRDGGNFKQHGRIVLAGGHTPVQAAELLAACDEDERFFVPETVGIPHLRAHGWDDEIDHAYHTIAEVEATDDAPNDRRDIATLIEAFRGAEWDAAAALVARAELAGV